MLAHPSITLRTQRRFLRSLTFLLLTATVVLVALALSPSESLSIILQPAKIDAANSESASVKTSGQVDPKSTAWRTPLRRPLFDPPPTPPPKVVKKQLPPIRAKLLGTIIEPGASRAMIGLPGGKVEFRGVGEELGAQDPDATITKIGPKSISVARGDETTELTIDRGY